MKGKILGYNTTRGEILWTKTQKWLWVLNDDEIDQTRNPATWDSASFLNSGSEVPFQHNSEWTTNFWSLYLLAPSCSEGVLRLSRKLAACFLTLFELPWQALTEVFVKTCPEFLTKLCLESVQNLLNVMVIIWSEVLKLS